MKIYSGTGTISTQTLKVQKSIESLIICSDKTPDQIQNETITVYIERSNMPNKYFCNAMPLIDFIMLTNYGNDAIVSSSTLNTIAKCNLSDEGAVRLLDGEVLNIIINGLNSAKTYEVHTIEDPILVEEFFKFDRKTCAIDDTVKTVNVKDADLCVIDLPASVQDVTFKFVDGSTTKHTPFELQIMSKDIDPVFALSFDGKVIQNHPTKVAFPLDGVKEIEVVKSVGDLVTITTRTTNFLTDSE